ncbi:hypothetical protein [Streptomyces sp. CB00455]|nr:hypothetical protein [Streptomyces sp. CB00455]
MPHLVLEQLLFWLCGQGLAERLIDGSYVPFRGRRLDGRAA